MIAFRYTANVFMTLYAVVWLLAAYLAGSIPFGWLVARARGVDIRAVGSGNIGMTNVWRTLGWPAGVTVLVLDIAKGLAPVLLQQACIRSLAAGQLPAGSAPWLLMATGLSAILGHTFTPWLRFKGGKGVATAAGVLLGLLQGWLALPVAALLLMVALFRYVSLGSLTAAIVLVAMCACVRPVQPYWPLALATALLVFWTHRSNIKRLLQGTEARVGRKHTSARPKE